MIPVASKELSLELSRVGEWNTTYFEWFWHTKKDVEPTQILARHLDDVVYDIEAEFCPAYDLSYLFNKFPPGVELRHVRLESKNYYWMATYAGDEKIFCETADTAEDALCGLAIIMIEGDELK